MEGKNTSLPVRKLTLCVHHRACLFGDVVEGRMRLNEMGRCAEDFIPVLPQRYPGTRMDGHVVMPNHIHWIAVIEEGRVGPIHELALPGPEAHRLQRRVMLIPKMVGFFKMNVAKRVNQIRSTPGIPVWQEDYYERVIRNEMEWARVRDYIVNNPANWESDTFSRND